jgi:hypothetical protein
MLTAPLASSVHINLLTLSRFLLFVYESHCSVGRSVGSFCSPFELTDCALAEHRIARKIVSIDDRVHVA